MWLFRLEGEIDLARAPSLLEDLRRWYRETAADRPADQARLAIDCGDVTFIDAAGFSALDDFRIDVLGGRRLMLVDPSMAVRRFLELVGADDGYVLVVSEAWMARTSESPVPGDHL
jgi:anti-anti-sigma regulatory factor